MSNGTEFYESELFKSLILNFQVSAMIGMGKIVNPVTQKAERNLNEAKVAIDMLNMIANKTKGNLTDEENRMVQQTLTDLRLNYVNEKSQPEPKEEKTEPAEAQTEAKQPDKKKKGGKKAENKKKKVTKGGR